MERLDLTSLRALRAMLETQPATEAKVSFAWTVAAGPTLARNARASWSAGGTLRLTASSDAWRREIVRAKPTILDRLNQLLGVGVVRAMTVDARKADVPRSSHA